MALTLHVTSYKNHPPTTELSVNVNDTACSIGRASNNDLTLADVERIISHRHAIIEFENGNYYLTDNSTNGVYINHGVEPVGQGKRVALHNGDIVGIGKYECAITIAQQSVNNNVADIQSEPQSKPEGKLLIDDSLWQPPVHGAAEEKKTPLIKAPYPEAAASPDISPAANSAPTPAAQQNYFQPPQAILEDWDELTGLMKKNPSAAAAIIPESGIPESIIPQPITSQAVVSEAIIPQEITPKPVTSGAIESQAIPGTAAPKMASAAVEELNIEPPMPQPHVLQSHVSQTHEQKIHNKNYAKAAPAPHETTPESTQLNQQLVNAFLSGAGLTDVEIAPEAAINFMHSSGQLLREITQGFRQILLTRTSLKGEFRLGMTTLQPAENNPVKFSIDVEDALTKLLLPPAKGYLPPLRAIQEATDDLQAHQMALLSGLRAALSSLIALFDPQTLENDLQNVSAVDNLLPMIKKAKYWELFKKRYREAAADAENDFLHSLGDEFAVAYEQQIQRLKNSRHNQ